MKRPARDEAARQRRRLRRKRDHCGTIAPLGEMDEWFKSHAWKACKG